MKIEISEVTAEEELRRIYELRYSIYVEEMGRYKSVADHEKRQLWEPEDEQSRRYIGRADGKVVSTMRSTWGGDAALPSRQVSQYSLQPFLDVLPTDQLVVGERFMVTPEYRGTEVLFRMFCTFLNFANQNRIQLIFGDCEPHLLNLYLGLGFRTYSSTNINSSETGYLIPLVMVVEDVEYLRQIGSPLSTHLTDFGDKNRIPANLPTLVSGGAVLSQRISGDATYWSKVHGVLSSLPEQDISIFTGLSEPEIQALLDKSSLIECREGDHLIKKGNVTQNLFIVLRGLVEVRDGDTQLAIIGPGETIGEMAFLLNQPRTRHVYALSDDVQILSISETVLRQLMKDEAETASKLLYNISKLLCVRLAKME